MTGIVALKCLEMWNLGRLSSFMAVPENGVPFTTRNGILFWSNGKKTLVASIAMHVVLKHWTTSYHYHLSRLLRLWFIIL